MATRKELLAAVITRYGVAATAEKVRILDEFNAVTGYHRKHAIRFFKLARHHIFDPCYEGIAFKPAGLELSYLIEKDQLLFALDAS